MRPLFLLPLAFSPLLLAGCASAPNDPTLTLQTSKTPAQYAECVIPKLQGNALNPMVSQTQRSYRIVVPSKVSADNVLEAYKAGSGGKVFIYERHLLASTSCLRVLNAPRRNASDRPVNVFHCAPLVGRNQPISLPRTVFGRGAFFCLPVSGWSIICPDELDERFQGRWYVTPAGVVEKKPAWRRFPLREQFRELPIADVIAHQLLVDVGNSGAIFCCLDHQRIVFKNERSGDGQADRLPLCLILPGIEFAAGKTSGDAGMVEQVAWSLGDSLRGQIGGRGHGHERLRGPTGTAIMSPARLSPKRTPASNPPFTISVKPSSVTRSS